MDFSKEVKILMSTDENTHFKQDAPLVSVIVPVFNRLPFLEQLFKTINAQSLVIKHVALFIIMCIRTRLL